KNGANPEAVARRPSEAETLALKVDNLLFPMPGHRLQKFIHLPYTDGYDFGTNVGIMGGLGFLIVLGKFLFEGRISSPYHGTLSIVRGSSSPHLHVCLGILLIACLLLATTGGFGYLFSWLMTPWIRCYYRISIFIAFLSLFGLVIVLDKL